MFCVGQTVLYGSNGVCTIDDVTIKSVGRSKIEYYVLKPLCSDSSTLFVPTGNQALVGRIRSILPEEEAKRILANLPECEDWSEPKTDRSERFKEIITKGDCAELVRLVRTIYFHGRKQIAEGKRLHISDERFLKEAEKMVCEELSLVLNVESGDILSRILVQADNTQ